MDKLPDELLLMIFRYIDDHRQRARLERVCRRWRTIMQKHGWKPIRRIKTGQSLDLDENWALTWKPEKWFVPVGERCGAHLVECSFDSVDINATLIRFIIEHFSALKHLAFLCCSLKDLDANALESFSQFGARLHSLTLFQMDYQYLRHFSHLRHLGLYLYNESSIGSLLSRFFADLRYLYLKIYMNFSSGSELEKLLPVMQRDSPMLAALYLDFYIGWEWAQAQPLLSRISDLKNLRFLRTCFDYDFTSCGLLCSCLNNLSKLLALQLTIHIQQLPNLFRSPTFRGLVHLSLNLHIGFNSSGNFESIGLLSTVAPHLRSLSLVIPVYSSDQAHDIGRQLIKIAQNGKLEFLNVPCAKFAISELDQLIQLCPNLHSLGARLWQNDQLPQVSELRSIVANQWHAGTRKHVPLRVWIYECPDEFFQNLFPDQPAQYVASRHDPFLPIHIVRFGFAPPNPVLNALFRDEVFNNDAGGTPSFVLEHYSSKV